MLPLAALLLLLPQEIVEPAPPVLRQVTVQVTGKDEWSSLLRAGFDVVHCSGPARGAVDLLCTDEELAKLAALGHGYDVVHQDASAFYAARLATPESASGPAPALGAWLSPPFGQGSMGGYYTFDEVVSVLDQIAAAYPTIVAPKQSLGQSYEGRDLWAVKVSDQHAVDENEPEVRFDSLHHCREPGSMQALIWTLLFLAENYGTDPFATWLIDNREMWFVPVVNPDGYVYNSTTNPGGGGLWKKNRRVNFDGTIGVELNRNYPFQWGLNDIGSSGFTESSFYRGTAPASEPEVAAMVAFMEERSFVMALSCHTYSDLWMYPWAYTVLPAAAAAQYAELSARATEVNGYAPGQASQLLYPAHGVTIDHDHGVHGTFSWTPEIGGPSDGFYPPQDRIVPLAEENRVAFLRTALAAGAAPYISAEERTELGDGDGRYEPGEAANLDLTVRNAGAAGSPVTVTVVSLDPALTVAPSGPQSLENMAPFSGASAPTFTLSIAPGVTESTLPYEVRVAWDGYIDIRPATLPIGALRPFLTDDLEVELGWIAGAPGDAAVAGLWEYGDPVGTSSGGEPLNPEDDATPGPENVRCYATGNGSSTPSGDDVDGGPATLITPALHLASAESALLSYSRWFADFGNVDDVMTVSISDDDGASWTTLETVDDHDNEWNQRTFVVEDAVDLTDQVRVRFRLQDIPNNSVLEAAIDDLRVDIAAEGARMNVYGRPEVGTSVALHVSGSAASSYGILQSSGTGFAEFAQIDGSLLLDAASLLVLHVGSLGSDGLGRVVASIPARAGLAGTTLFLQSIVAGPDGFQLTNRDQLTFE